MEIRQILMVALFMFAAAIMKSAMPGQMPVAVVAEGDVVEANDVESTEMITALAPAELLLGDDSKIPVVMTASDSEASLQRSGFVTAPIPGSLIALVVAAMGLVSVARRPL